MRGKSLVLARLVKVSAAVLGAGLLVTGCSPVKMGAAAVVGSQRITLATLDTECTAPSHGPPYPVCTRRLGLTPHLWKWFRRSCLPSRGSHHWTGCPHQPRP